MHWLRLASIFSLATLLSADLRAAEESPDQGHFDYQEVYQLLKSQLPEVEEPALQDAAARGLIRELAPRVRMVTADNPAATADGEVPPAVFKVYEDHYAYVRFGEFKEGMAEEARPKLAQLAATPGLHGLVLDLRFAGGESYADAGLLADPFFASEVALIDWGQGEKKSTVKTNALTLPVAVLINRHTAQAAEAMAAMLRHGRVGLLIGSPTAGQASMYRQFELTTGQRLLIATEPVTIGGETSLSAAGVAPDISVDVATAQEKEWLQDPYQSLAASTRSESLTIDGNGEGTGGRRHLNEADLVRMLREGEIPDLTVNPAGEPAEPAKPVIRDPVLARGLDFLKGLAVVRKMRP